MINYLVLHYSNGDEKTIKWGDLPDTWKEGEFKIPRVTRNEKLTDTVVIEHRIFHCHKREEKFSRLIGHYYEEIKYADNKKIKGDSEKSLQ